MKTVPREDLRTLHSPGQDSAASLLHQVVSIILNGAVSLNHGIEGNDDDPAPSAVIRGSDAGKVVCEKAQRVGWFYDLRLLVLLFHLERVCA